MATRKDRMAKVDKAITESLAKFFATKASARESVTACFEPNYPASDYRDYYRVKGFDYMVAFEQIMEAGALSPAQVNIA